MPDPANGGSPRAPVRPGLEEFRDPSPLVFGNASVRQPPGERTSSAPRLFAEFKRGVALALSGVSVTCREEVLQKAFFKVLSALTRPSCLRTDVRSRLANNRRYIIARPADICPSCVPLLAVAGQAFLGSMVATLSLWLGLEIVVLVPLRLLAGAVTLVGFGQGCSNAVDSTSAFVKSAVFELPSLALFLTRYIYPDPLDKVFLAGLRAVSPDRLYPELAALPYRTSYFASLRAYFVRSYYRLRVYALVGLLSLLPAVGRFAVPLGTALVLYRSLGTRFAAPVAAAGFCAALIPGGPRLMRWCLRLSAEMRSFPRELLEPFFCRVTDRHERHQWLRRRNSLLLGFSMPFYLLLEIPVIGVAAFGIAQASIALLLSQELEKGWPSLGRSGQLG